jgi:hypothetical protein
MTAMEVATRGRTLALTAPMRLAALVAVSFVARLLVTAKQATPTIFPDEYIYTAISRSIATSGLPEIRGHIAHFPPLLASILTAPAWLFGDVSFGFRAAQGIAALALSLAAVPAYLLARRIGVGAGGALGVAALTLVVPDTVFVSFMTAESFAYPLALAALWAGVAALERPTRRTQLLFVVLAGLATFARIQFVVLAAAFMVAVVVVGWREHRLRAVLKEQRLPLGLFAALAVALAVLGLGYYGDVVHLKVLSLGVLESAGNNVFVLLCAAGVALVPGAAIGLWLGIAKPQGRGELAFSALTLAFAGGVLGEAALYGSSVHERYVFYVVPLLAIAFLRYAERGWPAKLAHVLLAVLLAVGATAVPLTTLGSRGEANASLLVAVHFLLLHVANAGDASAIALAVLTVALIVAVAVSARPRIGVPVVLAVSIGIATAGLAGATVFQWRNAQEVRDAFLPPSPSWVDEAKVGHPTLVQASGGLSTRAHVQLFWNRSVDRVALLPNVEPIDAFTAAHLNVAQSGTLVSRGAPLTGPLLFDQYASYVRLRGATEVGAAGGYHLYTLTGPAQLGLYFAGLYDDGWVAPRGTLDLWAPVSLEGTLRLRLETPTVLPATRYDLRVVDGKRMVIRLAPGASRTVSIPVCAHGGSHWRLVFGSSTVAAIGDRAVGGRAGKPVFVPGKAC